MKYLNQISALLAAGTLVAVSLPLWAQQDVQNSQATEAAVLTQGADAAPPMNTQQEEQEMVTKDVLGYEMETIDGGKQKLDAFRGKVIMMVNVASECGLTPQYEQLEKLYREHKKDGLVIIGFPANNFAGQEPGTNAEIAEFCSSKFGVTFPMMAKISVKGEDAHPLYKQLAAQPEPIGGEPEWNFDKYVVNRAGEVVARFKPRTTPEDPAVIKKLKDLLAEDS
ncbi:MAG: glutathione peroxidase [Phycisphaerales bacterium]